MFDVSLENLTHAYYLLSPKGNGNHLFELAGPKGTQNQVLFPAGVARGPGGHGPETDHDGTLAGLSICDDREGALVVRRVDR